MAIRIYGNREIKTLPGEATRPTSSKVREALFNIWQGRVLGAKWLDLCAGSGAMGAEALCRGAAEVIGIEKSGAACRVVSQNWQKVSKEDQHYQVIRGDVVRQMKGITACDLVYFDPPYAGELYPSVLAQLADCLSDDGEAAVEYGGGHWRPDQLSDAVMKKLEIVREKRYGSTCVAFFSRRL
ncbi:MAG: 16S rRNA (guanine(966)-N(2))-methyltransferase RsmD [Cyanobacteria bacterium J06621_11]